MAWPDAWIILYCFCLLVSIETQTSRDRRPLPNSLWIFIRKYDMKIWLPTQIIEKSKSVELLLVGMRSFVAGVAVQQPVQVLLKVRVVNAWIV